MRLITAFAAFVMFAAGASVASATTQLHEWQIWHQPAASEFASRIFAFDAYTLYFNVPITLLVMALLLIVMIRFRASANPVPSRTSHNSLIEAAWTIVPIIVLVAIAVPSFGLLKFQMAPTEEPALTVKATGNQWYWSYEYPDHGDISFDSLMLTDAERTDPVKQPRLLSVDNELVVPTGVVVRMQVIGADVIHSFAVPSLGFKIDAIPGRLNETWFEVDREGVYYGQCSELCGRDHAFMPIAIHAVSPDRFATWVAAAKTDLDSANKALAEASAPAATVVAGN